MVSMLYKARNMPLDSIKIGTFQSFPVFMDKKSYNIKIYIEKRETINVNFGKVIGKIKCIKVVPYVVADKIFKTDNAVNMWISDDLNHIPVMLKIDLIFGKISIILNKFRNLKHPLLIER